MERGIAEKMSRGAHTTVSWGSHPLSLRRETPPAAAGALNIPGFWEWLRGSPLGLLGAFILTIMLTGSALAPWLSPHDPLALDPGVAISPPSAEHPLGTDHLGRDVLSRLLHGGRASLGAALIVVAVQTLISLTLGTLAGYLGGWADEIVMRIIDVLLALPSFILALVVAGILGPGLRNLILAMIMVRWAGKARIVRSLVLSQREQPYILAARSVGASSPRIMLRHILPNVWGPVIVLATLDLGAVILGLCGLSFIGLGVQLPHPEWGAMLNHARVYMETNPRLMMLPGAAIALSVLAANLLGDSLRDYLDPRSRRQGLNG